MADFEKQTPVRQTFCGSLRRGGHWKCLSLTLMIVGCLTAILWCHLAVPEQTAPSFLDLPYNGPERSGPCRDGYVYIPVACMIMLYLVYLVECWHSQSRMELRYKCDIPTVYTTISKMQAALPVVWWKAICYHYVRRTRQVIRYRNGDAFTSTQVYYERVDSNTAGAAFNFTRCGVKDISRPLSDLEMYTAVKVKISKGFSFASVDTEFQFEEQRSQFFQEYETKDDYMEGREGMDLINVDFKEYMIAFRDPDHVPWYVSHLAFWLASVLLLSWPLRTVIEFKTAHLHYHIHKLFGSNYLEGENHSGLMTRVNTMNSAEFEMSIRNNNVVAPSYSEVMLADTQDPAHLRTYGSIKTYHSKVPRSFTNITLAARPASATRRSATPTVSMTHVKKFKSCSAFGVSEFMEPSAHSSSLRQHIQHLLRDTSRIQRKRTAWSHGSISGLSLGNGNVRFNVGTPGSPEDFLVTPSFSSYSVTSSRTHDEAGEFIRSRPQSQGQQFLNDGSSCREFALQSPPSGLVDRPTHESLTSEQTNIDNLSSKFKADSFVTSSEQAQNPGQGTTTQHKLPLLPVTNTVAMTTNVHSTPPSPSSPPGYEEALRMRRITPSAAADPAPTVFKSGTEIELTRSFPSAKPLRNVLSSQSRDSRDKTSDDHSITTRAGIDEGQSVNPSVLLRPRNDIPGLDTFLSAAEAKTGDQQYYHHHHEQRHHQQQKPILKVLPKVRTKICPESDNSDLECLHSPSPEHGPSDTDLPQGEGRLGETGLLGLHAGGSNRTPPVTLTDRGGPGDISTLVIGLDRRRSELTLLSTVLDGQGESGCSGQRKETSV